MLERSYYFIFNSRWIFDL